MWNLISLVVGLAVGFVVGMLVGRKNPKEADKLANLAEKAKDKLT